MKSRKKSIFPIVSTCCLPYLNYFFCTRVVLFFYWW